MFIIYKIQKWMDTMAGQTFMQYAYSWGAAIVILGTLFKLTHLPGANLMLFIGMGTEVLVFVLSGFERVTEKAEEPAGAGAQVQPLQQGTVVIGGAVPVAGGSAVVGGAPMANVDPEALAHGAALSAAAANLASAGQAAAEAQLALSQLKSGGMSVDPNQIKATDPAAIEEAVKNYAEELTELTEVLSRVKAQAARMSTDSEEMENLNRTLTGIATVYELQLRNISKQVSTIEQIDEQTRKMAEQIEELNKVYARMIQALTVNMAVAPSQAPAAEK
ncbi:MAG: gliding motility protein GldL [Bacteroidaceae bacterium]|nr:gliding motility protein GldL [Bacteroidaceae bacterium]MBQ3130633.1 gliding motility protein GldL [Bacteroidaceae bacterium]MBQ8273100.1 gliding motility protein GldL [Bacteroidaceae bacterium]